MFTKFFLLFLLIGSTANAAYFPTFSINNFNALGVYNLTPPVLIDGQTDNLQLDSSGNLLIKINGTSGPISFTSTQLPPALGAQVTANSMAVNIASDQVVPTKAPVSVNGSGSAAAATVSTVITLSAPANATGFILMNMDTSTANLRWAIGRVAAVNLGQQLQPGRDSGFVPCGANVSLIAESGTQDYDIQWVSQ